MTQEERCALLDDLVNERVLLIRDVAHLVMSYVQPRGNIEKLPSRIDFTRLQEIVDKLLPDILEIREKMNN